MAETTHISWSDATGRTLIPAKGISCDPAVMAGMPCISGTRIPSRFIADFARAGYDVDRIMREYPSLTVEQICDALAFQMRLLSLRNTVDVSHHLDMPVSA